MKTQEKRFQPNSKFLSLALLLFVLIMAVLSLLPQRPRLYTAYPLEVGIRLEGKILMPGKNGEGTITFPDKTIYRGAFTDGHFDGKAEVELDPSYLLKGTFKQGNLVSGEMQVKAEGTYVLSDEGIWAKKEEKK